MKKQILVLTLLGLFLLPALPAQAEYAVVFSYNTGGHSRPRVRHHETFVPAYPCNRGYYTRGYYYWPRPVVHKTTVVTTRQVQPKAQISAKERLGISDVIVLSKAGVNDDAIIDKIAKTGSVFDLSAEEVVALRKEGVSSRVVNFMLNTRG